MGPLNVNIDLFTLCSFFYQENNCLFDNEKNDESQPLSDH